MAEHYVYRFYAELKDYKPKIWRIFEINGEKSMAELGYALMLMFEMQASHLFCFTDNQREALLAMLRTKYSDEKIEEVLDIDSIDSIAKNTRFELAYDEMYIGDDEQLIEADKIKLNHITKRPGWKLNFEYDYGDSWEIEIELVDCEKREVSLATLPFVYEGEGFGIVEDVGGVAGLEELATSLKKGSGEQYDFYCAWLCSTTLDLDLFDKNDINYRLKKLMRVYKEIYEYRYIPTDRMLAVLLRDYLGKGPRGY